MTNENYDVIVIGSGPGGTSTATLLQKRGVRCLLIEKNNLLGGKMISIEKDGYAYDLFPHGQVPLHGSVFEDIFQELGVRDEFETATDESGGRPMKSTLCYRRKDWSEYKITEMTGDSIDPEPLFDMWELDESEKQAVVEIMSEIATISDEDLSKVDALSMKDWLIEREVPEALFSYFAFHANASLAEPIDLVSASEHILIMKQLILQGGGGQYKGGFGMLTKVMIREFENNGGKIIKCCRVNKVLVEKGGIVGVETENGIFHAPVVVSTAGIQPTILKLVGEQHFDKSYVNYIRELIPGWGFTSVRYFLNKTVMQHAIYAAYSDDSWVDTERFAKIKEGHLPDEAILFMCNHSYFDENAAPPGKQVLVAGTVCSSNPEAEEIEHLWKITDQQMEKFFPEICDAIERREYAGPKEIRDLTRDSVLPGQGGECVGLAQIVGQCGKDKPKSKTPINGLYIAGSDAGGRGMGTHQSGLSAMAVADMVQVYLRKRSRMR